MEHETINCVAIRETSTRDRADARQGWLARNSAAPCGERAKEETPVCGFVNTVNDSSLVVFENTENSFMSGLPEQSLTSPSSQDPISSTGRVPLRPFNLDKVKFNLYNIQVQPVQGQVQPVQPQVQEVQNQFKPINPALLVQHQIESSCSVWAPVGVDGSVN